MPYNIPKITDVLPPLPKRFPFVNFSCTSSEKSNIQFNIRRDKVLNVLIGLNNNDRFYSDMYRIERLLVDFELTVRETESEKIVDNNIAPDEVPY